ncbi:MAG: glycosyltransferase family 4 protein [Desulfobacteraceae bacterium]|nr:glycosyltransferase family 4 protein [Desulfobacteraceae bacterium]MBC2755074.1 glycosyltransferase family 4 protein [Desulfobacteraceae bacterium]
MKICFICSEFFAWGKYGGFGRATRMLSRELVKRDVDVCAVVPRRRAQQPVEILDGITVYSYPFRTIMSCGELFKTCDADVYHSEQPSLTTYNAMKAMPSKKHLITFRDPKGWHDWLEEIKAPSVNRIRALLALLYEHNYFVTKALQRADALCYCSRYLGAIVPRVYSINKKVSFLPNPIYVPDVVPKKRQTPTVAFVGRWDRRKRPQLFFELARRHPSVRFIAPGKSQDQTWDRFLRETYGSLPNVEMPGFIDQFTTTTLFEILEKSWIVVNTSTREGLPTSFLEALAHKCALLSAVNPERLSERYGYHVHDGNFDRGLSLLLQNGQWRVKGEEGYQYVKEHYELENTIAAHIATYNALLEK